MLRIESVDPGSYADDLHLKAGDCLMMINGQEVDDLVDYYRLVETEQLEVEILRPDGDLWQLSISKDHQEGLGLEMEHPEPQQCGNRCLFCFVHQLPKGMRRTLYIKDEDYRFSFLYGSYITLTNLQTADLERILRQRLSPLYISVHATDDQLRAKLLGRPAPSLLPLLKQLNDGGIELHCQIVLCPELNDGKVLSRSIQDLAALHPGVASLAVVPVGLTAHRQGLPQLRKLTGSEAQTILEMIHQYQRQYLTEKGCRFVFAADELYLQADLPIPDLEAYENLPQIENGVGLVAQFRQQADEVLLETETLELERATLVTGRSFAAEMQLFAERMQLRCGVKLNVVAVENRFFGREVTVTGLLTGTDLLEQLAGLDLGNGLLLPDVLLKDGERLLLDDVSVDQLEQALGVPVLPVDSSPWGVLDGLERLSGGLIDIIRC